MKKIIKKFWGVGLVLVLLSTLFVGAIPQAAAGNFVFSDTFLTPSGVAPDTVLAPVGSVGFGIWDVAQSGSTIYATGNATVGNDYLYKSTDGGATWVQAARSAVGFNHGLPMDTVDPGWRVTWGLVAVAPDDPNIVVVVNTENQTADTVWLSTNGGQLFQQLTGNAAADINCVAISPLMGVFRYITIGGATVIPAPASGGGMLQQWTMGSLVTGWAAPTNFANLAVDDVDALAYSTNFLADQCLLVVTEIVGINAILPNQANGAIGLHVYRYDIMDWDQNVDASFPRYLERSTNNTLTLARASIVLDANFYMGDEAAQIGFIGADITENTTGVNGQGGGVYRLGTYVVVAGNSTITQIDTGTAINSVAWDGTNLMAAVRGVNAAGLVVRRSATALGPVPLFLPSTTVKTPGTGNATLVLFNASSGVGLAFSRGNGSAICRTTDYGKSFNGYALVNSNFANINDMWTPSDGSVKYYTTDDGVDINLWRQTGFTWERVFLLPAATTQNWTVSVDMENSASVYVARVAGTTMYKSTDSGNTVWSIRTCPNNIQDIVVQDTDTIYVGVNGQPWIRKATGALTTWGPPITVGFSAAGGSVYSLNLLADDTLLVGGTTGGVAYTTDGGTTWTGLTNIAAGNVLAVADGLAAGNNIYAISNAGGTINRWTIGVNFVFWTAGNALQGGGPQGLELSNGVLYVMDPTVGVTVGHMHRLLQPAVDFTGNTTVAGTGTQSNVIGAGYVKGINILFATEAGTTTTLYSVDQAAFDPINSYSDYLTSPSNAPAQVYPLAGSKISVNSINGAVAAFVFKWTSPPVVVPPVPAPQTWNYNVEVYLDETGLVPVAGSPVGAQIAAASPAADLSLASGGFLVGGQVTGAGGIAVPGETYYWRVRVDMGAPVESYWSTMQSFTIEQLVAVVPIISSPENGTSVDTATPAFSWSPIAGATSYSFELYDTADVDNATPIYSVTTTTAGAAVPTPLTRGSQYFWRVKALTPAEGEWSTLANFIVAEIPPEQVPPVIITTAPQPTINVTVPPAPQATTTVVTVPPAVTEEVNPTYIWAIIIIGAVLVIAVIVLIVRTRRSV